MLSPRRKGAVPLRASSSLHICFTLLSYTLKYKVSAYLISLTPCLVGTLTVVSPCWRILPGPPPAAV